MVSIMSGSIRANLVVVSRMQAPSTLSLSLGMRRALTV